MKGKCSLIMIAQLCDIFNTGISNFKKYSSKILGTSKKVEVDYIEERENECVIVHDINNEISYVICNWTEFYEIQDILSNLLVDSITIYHKINNYAQIHLHKGYYNRAFALKKRIGDGLQKEVIFTGFSMGGAIAQILSLLYMNQPFDSDRNIKCVSFGSPGVIRGKHPIKNVKNYQINGDVVCNLWLSYRRLGVIYEITENGKINLKKEKNIFEKSIALFCDIITFQFVKKWGRNHKLSNYISYLGTKPKGCNGRKKCTTVNASKQRRRSANPKQ